MTPCHVYTNVGPRRPNGFPCHQRRRRGDFFLYETWVYIFLYDHVVYFGGSEAPILYMTLMYYDITFLDLMKNIYDDRLLFYLHV